VNNSESTGKIGQEIPANQPAPLQPSYGGHQETKPPSTPRAAGKDRAEAKQTQAFDDDFSAVTGEEAEPAGVVEPTAPGEGKLVHELQPESPSQPPPEPQAAGQKLTRGFVVLAIGLPGSGKTTWFKRRGVTPLSSDMLRSILFDDITEQRYQGLVFSTLRSLLRARLIAKMPWNYVDATNLSPHERRQWIKMAKSFGYEVQAVFFDVPFDVCMERNHRRERVVSDETMKKMAERLRPPNFKEGFSKITVVRVKGSASAVDAPPAAV
jgi:predicted kinase